MISEKMFGPEGLLAVELPAYEHRPSQQEMSAVVAATMAPSLGRTR